MPARTGLRPGPLVGLACALLIARGAGAQPAAGYNVLFVVVDDLRPELGAYGVEYVHTPRIDGLAARAVVFERAYAQAPICSPSRMSFLTGLRVGGTGIRVNNLPLRAVRPELVTLPQRFRETGYQATAQGKVFHGGTGDSLSWDRYDDGPKNRSVYQLPKNLAINDVADGSRRGRPYEASRVPDSVLTDGQIAGRAIRDLEALAPDRPFFLAVGMLKPHLPFIAPRAYWDLYPPSGLTLYERTRERPAGAPAFAFTDAGEVRRYGTVPREGPLPSALEDSLARGYAAAVSYMDAQVGLVLDALEASGRADSTIVVLFGDQGFKLGDLGGWAKDTPYELDARVPLLVAVPGVAPGRSAAVVELVDLYPTLLELTGVAAPTSHALSGESLVPELLTPTAEPVDTAYAFTELLRGGRLGLAVRDGRYRLVEWRDAGEPERLLERELYDYVADGGVERVNRAGRPALADVEARLARAIACELDARRYRG